MNDNDDWDQADADDKAWHDEFQAFEYDYDDTRRNRIPEQHGAIILAFVLTFSAIVGILWLIVSVIG